MKIRDVNNGLLYDLIMLNEANVVNIKDEFEGTSIAKYLKHFANNLGSEEAKTTFTKKLAKLFINDERFLYAVRNLPDNAPEWAREAMARGELMYFQPSQELDNNMEHLVHYVAAIEQDLQNQDKEKQVLAQRELAGFNKAETVDILINKSNEYFKRGSKKAGRSEEGTKEILDSGDGYRWLLLLDAEAYKREGKTLQNCIGSFWTREKAKREGKEIVVLRGPSNDSHVAARIDNAGHSIEEMKGKNNAPPVEKYMPYVIHFVNNMNLKLSGSAEYDFQRAGYLYLQDKLYSRESAIKEFIKTVKIADVDGGRVLAKINLAGSGMTGDQLGYIYPAFAQALRRGEAATSIYEVRKKDGTPEVSGLVKGRMLVDIQRYRREVTESFVREALEQSKMKEGQFLISELVRRNIIDDVAPEIHKELFWNERIRLDTDSGAFVPIKAKGKFKTGEKHLEWEEHDDPGEVKQIRAALSSRHAYYKTPVEELDPRSIKSVFITQTSRKDLYNNVERFGTLVVLKTKKGELIPAMVFGAGDEISVERIGITGNHNQMRINKSVVDSMIGLANKENATLTKSFRVNNGIVKDGKEFKAFEPKRIQLDGEPSGVKIDLADLDLGDRLAAINKVVVGGNIRKRSGNEGEDETTRVHNDDTEIRRRIEHAIQGAEYKRGRYINKKHLTSDSTNWEGKELKDVYTSAFGGKTPDAIYLVDVKYGAGKSHQVFMLADRNKVILVDNTTARHRFQKWGDYDDVATQINAFAKKNGLTFEKDAISKKGGEFRVHNNELQAAATVQQKRIEGMRKVGKVGLEGTDELPFANEAKLVRMSPDEQALWSRQGLRTDTVQGEGWKLLDSAGTPIGVVVVKDNTIQAVYHSDGSAQQDATPEQKLNTLRAKSPDKRTMSYVKTAMEQFGWNVKPAKHLVVTPNSDGHKILKTLEVRRRTSNITTLNRKQVLQDADVAGGSGTASWNAETAADRHLYNMGLITAERTRGGYSISIGITALGRAALQQLEQGNSINLANLAAEQPVSDTWVKPERKQAPKPERTSSSTVTGRTKAGTSAERALNSFREFADENNRIPTRSEFMQVLMADPFNMSRAGAQTYYYTTKAKYAALNEKFSQQAYDELLTETASLRLDTGPLAALRSLLVG